MKKIHNYFLNNQEWYARWHKNSFHHKVHWALFVTTAVFLASLIATSTNVSAVTGVIVSTDPQIFIGYDSSGKIDTAINSELVKGNEVNIIVVLNLPNSFYNSSDTIASRITKSQNFNNAKASIATSIGTSGTAIFDLPIINAVSYKINSTKAVSALISNSSVKKAFFDRQNETSLALSTRYVGASSVWPLIDSKGKTLTGVGVRIAIIDTGVDYTHPDLGGCFGLTCKVIGGYDFFYNDNDPIDDIGHGTHVASIAAGKGYNGIAPDAKILAYKVCGYNETRRAVVCPDSTVIAAIGRATDPNGDGDSSDHVDVANLSLGKKCKTFNDGCGPNDVSSLAVDSSSAAGVIYAIAAGNSGDSAATISSPSTARSAISVAAGCTPDGILGVPFSHCFKGFFSSTYTPIADYSSRGPVIVNGIDFKKPDITAPGEFICAARAHIVPTTISSNCDSNHVRFSGTSMASPHVAGIAVLMKQAYPTFTPQQIKDRLKATARPILGVAYNAQGAGEVDVKAAMPTNGIPPLPTTPTGLTALTQSCGIVVFWGSQYQGTKYSLQDGTTVIYSGNENSFYHLGLVPNSNHSYSVRAENSTGQSVYSGTVTAIAPALCSTIQISPSYGHTLYVNNIPGFVQSAPTTINYNADTHSAFTGSVAVQVWATTQTSPPLSSVEVIKNGLVVGCRVVNTSNFPSPTTFYFPSTDYLATDVIRVSSLFGQPAECNPI